MGLKGTAFAFCVLIGAAGFGLDAEAARSDARQPGKTARVAAAPARPAAAPVRHATAKPAKHQAPRLLSSARAQGAGHAPLLRRASYSYGGISCVPYVRQVTGMSISGNGWEWWGNAAGSYARGHRPEPGSVLAFRSSGGMRSGHVAVVSRVVGPRHVLIDHANWGGPGIRRGSVMQGVHVIDVSGGNDWSEVRVQVGHTAENFGRSYPTYGFIYNRPSGTMMAGTTGAQEFEEVAEAPEPAPRGAPRAGQRPRRR